MAVVESSGESRSLSTSSSYRSMTAGNGVELEDADGASDADARRSAAAAARCVVARPAWRATARIVAWRDVTVCTMFEVIVSRHEGCSPS
jgi:hypothetical protein